jgi:hypothetical protein
MNDNLKSLERQLHSEGFLHTYAWQDGPNAFYPDHTHAAETAHIILDGEVGLRSGGSMRTFAAGELFDFGDGVVHSERMGSRGCLYLIGEK